MALIINAMYYERTDRESLRRDLLAETRLHALREAVEHDTRTREHRSESVCTAPSREMRPVLSPEWEI